MQRSVDANPPLVPPPRSRHVVGLGRGDPRPGAHSVDLAKVRHFITFVAVLLVLALTAALVAPLFIDWSRHRGQIEAELSAVIGAPVTVAGPIDIRFLPTPYLLLKDVSIAAAPGGAPALTCRSLQLEAALASLPSGRARFTLARLDHPVLNLVRRPDGALAAPNWRPRLGGGRIALDRLVVESGRLVVSGGDRRRLDIALDLDASAGSLIGPFRGAGQIDAPGIGSAAIQFASGSMSDGALPLKLEATRDGGPNLVFDGALTLNPSDGGGVAIAYAGAATATGTAPFSDPSQPMPWRASGTLAGDLGAATAQNLIVRFGPDERALEARGSAQITGGKAPRLWIDLDAKQLDFDALLRAKDEDAAPPARAFAGVARLVAPLQQGEGAPLAIDVAFTAASAIVGAQTISSVDLRATASAGAPLSGTLALDLPGAASLRLSGGLELGPAPGFKGALKVRLGDIPQLRDWATHGEPDLTMALAALNQALPYRAASATGEVEISAVGFSARDLDLTLDRSTLSGAIAYTAPVAKERARLFVDLSSDALDVDALPDLNLSAGLIGDADLALALQAAKLRIGRPGDAEFESGSLALKMAKTGDDISVEKLSLSGLGGASIEASGDLGPKGRWVRLNVDANRLDDVATLIGRVAPGAASRWLAARAGALSPAKATLQAWSSDPNAPGLDSLKAEGAAGATQFSLAAKRSGDLADATFTLDSGDGSALMRQLGLAAAAAATPRAHLEGSAKGGWSAGFDTQATGTLSGADFTWRGRALPTAEAGDASLFGAATLKTGDVSGLLVALGLARQPGAVAAPVDLAVDVALRGDQLALPRVTGNAAGSKVDAKLTWRLAAPEAVDPDVALAQSIAGDSSGSRPGLQGDLSLDRVSLAGLLGPAFGVPASRDASFAPPSLDPPPLDLNLRVGAVDLGGGATARSFEARLRLDHGRLDLDDAAMDLGGAHVSGRATARRDAAQAAVTGQVAVDPLAVDQPGLRGRVGGAFSFATSGDSVGALIGGLAGEGKIDLRGATVPRLDPAALTRVLARAQSGDVSIDQTNVSYALGLELDRASLKLPDGATSATLSGGVVRVGPLAIPRAGGSATANVAYDLRAASLTFDVALAEARGGKFWNGPPPAVDVSLTGGFDAPARRIDASALSAGLAAQAIGRETDRITALDADIRERAWFNRRLKAERFMRQREAEVAAYEAEQARLKAEQDRKKAEDDRRKAMDDAKRAQDETRRAQEDAAANPQPPIPPDVNASTPSPPAGDPPRPSPRPKVEAVDPTATGFY